MTPSTHLVLELVEELRGPADTCLGLKLGCQLLCTFQFLAYQVEGWVVILGPSDTRIPGLQCVTRFQTLTVLLFSGMCILLGLGMKRQAYCSSKCQGALLFSSIYIHHMSITLFISSNIPQFLPEDIQVPVFLREKIAPILLIEPLEPPTP